MSLSDKDMVGPNDDKNTVLVNVHTIDQCQPHHCCIHNPSQHHMATWKPEWNPLFKMMMRWCRHNMLHPDPDDIAHLRRRWSEDVAGLIAQHMCDGCCQPYGLQGKEVEA